MLQDEHPQITMLSFSMSKNQKNSMRELLVLGEDIFYVSADALSVPLCTCTKASMQSKTHHAYASARSHARGLTECRTAELIGARMHASYVFQSMCHVLVWHCLPNLHSTSCVLQRPRPGASISRARHASKVYSTTFDLNMYIRFALMLLW